MHILQMFKTLCLKVKTPNPVKVGLGISNVLALSHRIIIQDVIITEQKKF